MKIYPKFHYSTRVEIGSPNTKDRRYITFDTTVRVKRKGKYYLVRVLQKNVVDIDHALRENVLPMFYQEAIEEQKLFFMERCLAEVMKVQNFWELRHSHHAHLDPNQKDNPEYTKESKPSFSNFMLLLL
tara:strand:+ start:11650 stop:12036 length:387 start_codon:yes stop_codon:yes gene_type:complete